MPLITVSKMKMLVLFFMIVLHFVTLNSYFDKNNGIRETIYGIMITGKDDCRIEMAKVSAVAFFKQECKNPLHLIIINHHPTLDVKMNLDESLQKGQITEIKVHKNLYTLGDMRNLALKNVPLDSLWTTWDDDDYRSPHYLKTLYDVIVENKSSASGFMERYEFNANNKYIWKCRLPVGFVTILARKNQYFKYLSMNSMEDVNIRDYYPDLKVIDNNKKLMYIRLVHNNNTSLYVDANKKSVVQLKEYTNKEAYTEYDVPSWEKQIVNDIVEDYFRNTNCLFL